MRKEFLSGVIMEAIFVCAACMAAVIGAWSTFAWMALLCILTPLWLIVVLLTMQLQFGGKNG